MIQIGDKTYRNLEEQVRKNKEDIARHYEIDRVLANLGIKLVGQVSAETDLPDPLTYSGDYGDAYAVGNRLAVIAGIGYYTYYVFSRPDPDAGTPEDHWLNVGKISIVGPQGVQGPIGPQGPEGEPGSLWYSGSELPTISADMKDGFQALNTTTGDVYQLKTTTNGRSWVLTGNIRGPQGIQGIQGPQGLTGPVGPQGIQGPRGDVGGFINIRGILANINQLPTPATLNNLTVAYLVGTAAPYDLYVQIGESSTTATWNNTGAFNAATLVTVGGVGQNVWDADTKLDKITTGGLLRLYGIGGNGSQQTYSLITGANNVDDGRIPRYRTNTANEEMSEEKYAYVLPTGTPLREFHAANKRYVDNNFVAQQERTDTKRAAVYGISSSGEPELFVADKAQMANKVVITDDYGCLYSAEPRVSNHCATKNYVDTNFAQTDYVDDEIARATELVNALGIKSPTTVYTGFCSSYTVSVGTSFDSWKIENATYNIYEFDITGLSKITILSNLNGTVALGNPKSCIFLSITKEGNCTQATADIDLTPSDTLYGPFTLTPPLGSKYLYISTNASQATPHIQGF